MRGNIYTMPDSFKQLGLPSDAKTVEDFIQRHEGACANCSLRPPLA